MEYKKKQSFIQVPRFMTINVRLGLQGISKLASLARFSFEFQRRGEYKAKTVTCNITKLSRQVHNYVSHKSLNLI